MYQPIWLSGQSLKHEQVSVTFDNIKAKLCILMLYEIELMYTFGIIALYIFLYQMIMMWKHGTGSYFLITANSL